MSGLQPISKVLNFSPTIQKAEQTLRFKNKWLNQGFTQVTNSLVRDNTVSPVSRLLYILLMGRCFRGEFSYPGQDTLSKELGISPRQIRRYLEELEKTEWLQIKRRGLGKTNIYFLLKY